MKIRRLRDFVKSRFGESHISELVSYIDVELNPFLKNLFEGLSRISFADNFESFTEEFTVLAGAEIVFTNKLKSIPSGYLIINQSATGLVDGTTVNSADFVYLLNSGGSTVTAKVIWLK